MNRNRLTVLFVGLVAAAPAAAFAQSAERGAIPPGLSQDGSRPAEGALKGGTIQPGEASGVPERRATRRCQDLQGVLREQCLRDLDSASGGASAPPPGLPGVVTREPRSAPPPQNPR